MVGKYFFAVFVILLFISFALTGVFSYKGLCGYEYSKSSKRWPCMCMGIKHTVLSSEKKDYHCTGINFSYNKISDILRNPNQYFKTFAQRPSNNSENVKGSLDKAFATGELQKCESDSDCIFVKSSCGCNCSGCGGIDYDLVINKKHFPLWNEMYGCFSKSQQCPDVCCPVAKPVCEGNRCIDVGIDVQTYYPNK